MCCNGEVFEIYLKVFASKAKRFLAGRIAVICMTKPAPGI
jgi:hypothetical protein